MLGANFLCRRYLLAPVTTHPIVHPPLTEEYRNHVDATPDLEPQTTTQQQGIVPRLRVIHYANDALLLLPRPRLPSLLCVLFYDAPSLHAYVLLSMIVNPEAELATQE